MNFSVEEKVNIILLLSSLHFPDHLKSFYANANVLEILSNGNTNELYEKK